ncbi:response regulator [Paenibacillus sp. 2TAB23]|uniref:response regulator n=1 Tax=Paenibacillus sp. 2TAB23 TaxID=3233004 RepID=UPI003F964FD6
MNHLHGSHDTTLVAVSYLVAVVASYTVLVMVERLSIAKEAQRWGWLLFGSIAMGMGIWSMHFVGMLAFSLPEPVSYDLSIVFVSVLAAIAGSFIALIIIGRPEPRFKHVFFGGLLLASGISAMHYIGMAAMRINIEYDPFYFTLSIVIAIAASIAALLLAIYFRKAAGSAGEWMKLGAALLMGAAIAGMHYTGMAGAQFHVMDESALSTGIMLNQKWLAYYISTGTLVTLALSIIGIYISRKFAYKDSELQQKSDEIYMMNQELLALNEHLEDLVAVRTEQLAKAHDEAIQANLIKSQFLANMSHELRTPLNAIIGYSEMLQEEAEELGEASFVDDLSKISKAGNHLLALINDILDISKIEAGKMELHLESSSLPDLIQDVLTTIRPLVEGKGNQLQTICEEDGEIQADVTKLRQILINLLSNANKFTEAGSITFNVYKEARDGQSGYAFRVRDTGIGMTSAQLAKLFQPFTQADASTTRKYGGTGLGLAISQRFSQIMGGDIQVESEFSVGTTFTCWLPSSPSDALVSIPALIKDAASLSQEEAGHVSILLIDDEAFNRELMQRYLAKTGWKLAFAENGPEGLRLAKKLKPKVICLDILMPSMDGWSVLGALKSDPELAEIPVVVWSMTSDRQLGYTLGAAEFLMKPVQREQLLTVMDKYVANREQHSILVIEDDMSASELVARLLRKEGYAVREASNGILALASVEKETPALILLDLMMPEMDGFEFIEELRKQEAWRRIPIVVLTAKSITPEDERKLSGYVKNIVQKGAFNPQSLLAEIRPYLS